MSIGERMRQLRKGKYTQEALAEAVGVHVNTINKWENGKRAPDAAKLLTLAKALNTTVAYLTDEEDARERRWGNPPISQGAAFSSEARDRQGSVTDAVPGLDYWGGVVENAEKAAIQGRNLDLIVPMLHKACDILETALSQSKREVEEQAVGI